MLTVNSLDEFLQLVHLLLDAELGKDVVVLYAVEKLGQTPERVRFDDVPLFER